MREIEKLISIIIEKVNEIENDDDYCETAKDFADNVSDITSSMYEFYENRGYLTPKQIEALENIDAGLDRWISNREND